MNSPASKNDKDQEEDEYIDNIFYVEDVEKVLNSPYNDLILRNDEIIKLSTVQRIIQILNDADKHTTGKFFISHCNEHVQLNSTALNRPLIGQRDILVFWALTYDIYPDGIWESRGIDFTKGNNSTTRFKVKYSFNGARIYRQATGELFDTLDSCMGEDDGYKEVFDRMISLKSVFYSESWNRNNDLVTNYDSDVDLFESYRSNPASNNITCIPIECVGVINLDFDMNNNLISAIGLDVDTQSDRCERDLWTFTPLI